MEEALIAAIKERYEEKNGSFYVIKQYNSRVKVGDRAGNFTHDGYRSMRLLGSSYREHRLVWLLHHGKFPDIELDHINGVRDDNRIENLREVTRKENMQHKIFPAKTNQLGHLGAIKHGRKYRSGITRDGKKIYLGLFDTPEQATSAYLSAQAAHNAKLGGA